MIWCRTFIILSFCCDVVFAYDFECPNTSQWTRRAEKRCLDKNKYHCLLDTNRNLSRELCLTPDYLPEGFISTYSGNRDAKQCRNTRFSPFVCLTSDRYECIYKKTLCAGEGQLVSDSGSNIEDVTCRCDFKKGYGFITKPRNKCYCTPRTEDCSCYYIACPVGYILSTDYACVRQNSKDVVSTCPDIIVGSYEDNKETQQRTEIDNFKVNNPPRYNYSASVAVCLLTLVGILCVIAILLKEKKTFVQHGQHKRKRAIFQDEFFHTDKKGAIADDVRNSSKIPDFVLPDCVTDLSFIPKLHQILERHSLLLLKGRKGTGKRTIAYNICHQYQKRGYHIVHLMKTDDIEKGIFCKDEYNNCLLFFDDILDHPENFEMFRSAVKRTKTDVKKDKRTIVLATMKQLVNLTNCINDFTIERDVVFDLDNKGSYTVTDKENILRFHMLKNNLTLIEVDNQSGDKSHSINRQLLNDILKEDTFFGFPYMCALFCSHSDHIKLGLEYFRQPPSCTILTVDKLREHGDKDTAKACQYCILVNVLLYENEERTTENVGDITSRIEQSVEDIFGMSLTTKKGFSLKFIQQQIKELSPQFVYVKSDLNVRFSHPAIRLAVMISHSKMNSDDVFARCNILDILSFLKPPQYQPLQGEIIFTKDINHDVQFAKRVTTKLIEVESSAKAIIAALQKYFLNNSDLNFLILIEEELKSRFPVNVTVMTMFFRSFGKSTRRYARACKMTDILTFILAWEYLCSKMCGRFSDDFLEDLLHHDSIHHVLKTQVDNFGNTLLHYIIIWNEEKDIQIYSALLSKLVKKSKDDPMVDGAFELLKSHDRDNHSAIHFAAYLGRHDFLSNLENLLKSRDKLSLGKPTQFSYFIDKSEIKAIVKKANCCANHPLKDVPPGKLKISFENSMIKRDPPVYFGNADHYKKIKSLMKLNAIFF